MSFAEHPQWLLRIMTANLSAQAAVATKAQETGQDAAAIEQKAVIIIKKAYQRRDIDQKYLTAMFATPENFLIEVMTNPPDAPLIIRPRTLDEVLNQFPQKPNEDYTRKIPIGVSAELSPEPLFLDVKPGPILVTASPDRQDYLVQTIEETNRRLNAGKIRVFKNPTGHELDSLYSLKRLSRSIVIAEAEHIPPDDLQKIIQLSTEIPYHHVIIMRAPNNHVILPRELQPSMRLVYPPNEVFFIKMEPGKREQRYFPLALTR